GRACEFRSPAAGNALRNCAASIHRLWKTNLCRRSRRSALLPARPEPPAARRPGRRRVTPPGGPVTPGRGPLRGTRSAGGSAGGFFRGPVPRLIAAARRLLASGSPAPGRAGGPVKRGDVPVLPPADEAIRVVEVLIGGQQVRVRPYGVAPGGAPDVGQLAPDEGGLAQLARPQLEADQGGEGALRGPA